MTNPNITIHDALTGETIDRQMTDQEFADYVAAMPQEETPTE